MLPNKIIARPKTIRTHNHIYRKIKPRWHHHDAISGSMNIKTGYSNGLKPSKSGVLGKKPIVYHNTNLCRGLILKDFLTAHSKHAIIYNCEYCNKSAICKFVILDTGAFWSEEAKKLVRHNEIPIGYYRIPSNCFRLEEFFRKVPVKKDRYNNEIITLQRLGKSSITPKLFHHFTLKIGLNGRDSMNIGVIIMEKVDCTLESIVKERELDKNEVKLAVEFLKSFSGGFVHGDFKVGNIGVNLNRDKKIKQFIVLDNDYVKGKGQINSQVFIGRQGRDLEKFLETFQEKSFCEKREDLDSIKDQILSKVYK